MHNDIDIPQCNDTVIEANNKHFRIQKAVVYSYTKEIQALLNFPKLTDFVIVGIVEPPKKHWENDSKIQGVPCYSELSKDTILDADTLIISRLSNYEGIVQKDILAYVLEKAVDLGLNIFSLEYIDINKYPAVFERARERGLMIRHPMLGVEEYGKSQLYREHYGHIGTRTPVVGIFGTGVSQGKFTTQLMLRKMFSEAGYIVNNFGTETHSELFGFESFCPMEMNSSIRFPREQIVRYIQGEIRRLEIDNKPDIVFVGGQSGVIPFSYGLPEDEYTLPTLSVLVATIPHAYLLCVNLTDDIQFIADTVKVMEGLGKGKLIAVVSPKIKREYLEKTAIVKNTTVSYQEYKSFAKKIEQHLGVSLYDIMDWKDADELFKLICNYFS